MLATSAARTFVGLHHFGIWVDDIDAMKQAIEADGGKYHPGPSGHSPANAEHKFRDPYGIVFDISSHGWDGAEPLTRRIEGLLRDGRQRRR
jgi:hypothetical protein